MIKKPIADISIVAANYNNGHYLEAFIESILASSVLPSKIIIVDDGSTDNSSDVLKKYESHPLAAFIFLKDNVGFANALNIGIKKAQTAFIMRADPDDLLHPLKIEKQFVFLNKHPFISGVGCNVEYFHDKSGKTLNNSNFPLSKESIQKTYFKGEHGLQHPTVLIRSSVLHQFAYRQESVPAEDYEIFAKMISKGHSFSNLKEVLYRMRIHSDSASSNITFETVKKTYACRDEIFNQKTSVFSQKLYFWHILNYRKYLLEQNFLLRLFYLFLSVLFHPTKLLKRFN